MTVKEQFYVPLEIKTRRGRGKDFSFVVWQDVANRLNEILGVSWSSELRSSEIVGPNIIVRVKVSFINPETKEYCCQEGFGGAVNDERLEAGAPFKAAYSKGLKDAVKKWGLGLYLEDEDQPSIGLSPITTKPVINKPNTPSVPPTPTTQVTSTPTTQSSVQVPPMQSQTTVPPTFTAPVVPETVTTQTQPIPPFAVPGQTITQTPPETVTTQTQPIPPPVVPGQTITQTPPTFAVPENADTKPTGISDIQKVALGGIMSSKGITFEELAKEALSANGIVKDPFPSKDNLTYDEAVLIIKYGNNKFRS